MTINDYDHYVQSLNERQLHEEQLHKETVLSRILYHFFLKKANHLTHSVHKIVVTPVQLLTEMRLFLREMWFGSLVVHVCTSSIFQCQPQVVPVPRLSLFVQFLQ